MVGRDARTVTRPLVCALVLLGTAVLSVSLPRTVEGQRGGRTPGRGTRPRPAEPAPEAELGPGEYSLQFERVLEAINRGEGHQALAYYERTAAKAEQDGDRLLAARALGAVSVAALRLGRFQRAIQAGTRSIDIFTARGTLDPSDRLAAVVAYAQVGAAYRAVSDLARSRAVLEEGVRFAETQLSGRREGRAVSVLSETLARTAEAQRDYARALELHDQSSRFFDDALSGLTPRAPERIRVSTRRHAVQALIGVGRTQLMLGHLDEAGAAFDRAMKEAQPLGLVVVELDIVQGQASLALARRDWSTALSRYDRARIMAGQVGRVGVLPALNAGRARALSELGHTDEALAAVADSVRAVEQLRTALGDPELRTEFLDSRQRIYHQAVHLALEAKRPDEAFSYAERSRARAFLDLLGSQTTLSKGRTRMLVDEEVKLRAHLAEVQAQAQEATEPAELQRAQALVDAVDRDYRAFLERVRKESIEQAALMTVEPVTMAEIQALVPEGTNLLEYLVTESEVILWVVDHHGAHVLRNPGGRESLLAQVRRFRVAIAGQAPLAQVQAQAEALHERLLGRARESLRGDRLVIVPHGVLHYLPFGALRSPAGRWLVEDFTLATLPSASVLRFLADKGTAAAPGGLVVGNPDLGPTLALPWADREARAVGEREHDTTVLTRGDATESRVKKLVGTAGLVHFATHGDLRPSDPLSSAVLLVPGDGEDGRLEVRELFGLDLHARLVVLSACETGLGPVSRGDEIVGLERAFLYAGTPAVITTLWKIDDRASYELIRAFYAHLAASGPAAALRQAQQETMRAFPHPFAWAAFGLTGVP